MSLIVTHNFVSAKSEQTDPTLVGPNEWNANHNIIDSTGQIWVTDFQFTQTPGGSLTGGISNTITLNAGIKGLAGSDANHYLYISGGTGTAEAVLVTGGSYIASSGGTITFTPANNHSGTWTVTSATAGLQEAAYYSNSVIHVQTGIYQLYAKTTIPPTHAGIRGEGCGSQNYNTGTVFNWNFSTDVISSTNNGTSVFEYLSFQYNGSGTYPTAGAVFNLSETGGTSQMKSIRQVSIWNGYTGITFQGFLVLDGCFILTGQYGIRAGVTGLQAAPFFNNVYIMGPTSSIPAGSIGLYLNYTTGGAINGLFISGYAYGIYIDNPNPVHELRIDTFHIDGFSTAGIFAQSSNNFALCTFTNFEINPSLQNGTEVSINLGTGTSLIRFSTGLVGVGVAGISLGGVVSTNIDNIVLYNGAISYSTGGVIMNGAVADVILSKITGNPTYSGDWTYGFNINLSTATGPVQIIDCDGSNGATSALNFTGGTQPFILSNFIGVTNVFATVASSTSVALPTNSRIKITGTTQITTLTGGWTGRQVDLIFTNAAPGGVGTGGNIARTQTAAQNQKITLTFDGTNWY